MRIPKSTKAPQAFFFLTIFFISCPSIIESAELNAETVHAWNRYVQKTERRIQNELDSNNRFFIMDYQNNNNVLLEYKKIVSGDIVIRDMQSQSESQTVEVPGGTIHHWRGDILIQGANLEYVLSRIENPGPSDMTQEDVLESRILERSPDGFTLFLKLKRSKIVTVVYNTEHRVRFKRYGAMKASSSSVATRIVEVELDDGNKEQEQPEGRDHGFLWRMNSYWRYKQVPEGVIVECESLILSRKVPKILDYMIRPIIDRIARESLERTLLSMRSRMTGGNHESRIAKNIQTVNNIGKR